MSRSTWDYNNRRFIFPSLLLCGYNFNFSLLLAPVLHVKTLEYHTQLIRSNLAEVCPYRKMLFFCTYKRIQRNLTLHAATELVRTLIYAYRDTSTRSQPLSASLHDPPFPGNPSSR
jgi:hypothetical protein